MSGPRAGWLYENQTPGGTAELLLVLSENEWNEAMRDSVVVPVFRREPAQPNPFRVEVADGLQANCTTVQSVVHDHIGRPVRLCPADPWVRVRLGVRVFLDVDRRRDGIASDASQVDHGGWWPRQHDVHFASVPQVPSRKLFSAVSDDDWNAAPASRHCAAVRLTSKGPKAFRRRWEVPVSGGYVVAGDLYALPFAVMAHDLPETPYPQSLSLQESSAIADRQKSTLSLGG